MASRNLQIPSSYLDSDDSDGEDLSNLMTGMDYQPIPVEDLLDQISAFHRNVNNAELHGLLRPNVRVKRSCSKGVQTRPDVSGIPPSWILAGEELVHQLYNGLTNVMNSLYHSSHVPSGAQGHCAHSLLIREAVSSQESALVRPRLPSMRPQLFTGFDYQKILVNSDEFKKKLNNLRDTAAKLADLIPYLAANFDASTDSSDDKTSKTLISKSQQTNPKEIPPCEHTCECIRRSKETCSSKEDFTSRFSNLKIDFKASVHAADSSSSSSSLKSVGRRISQSYESVYTLPSNERKLRFQRSVDETIKKNPANVGKDRITLDRETEETITKATTCKGHLQNKDAASGTSNKNFIKKNILALKAQSGAASSSKSTTGAASSSKSTTGAASSSKSTTGAASHDTQRNPSAHKRRESKK